jgi:predicted RNase H-like nuclease (RuvC/YqgF family)
VTNEELVKVLACIFSGSGVAAIVTHAMGLRKSHRDEKREDVKLHLEADKHDDERDEKAFQRLIEECERKTKELAAKEDALKERQKETEELREAFHRLREAHLPQAVENSLMRIERRHAVEQLEEISELLGRKEIPLALKIVRDLITKLKIDIVLPKITP